MLVLVFWQGRQRETVDAVFDEGFDIFDARLTIDAALLDLFEMHLAGFLGKLVANIVRIADHVIPKGSQHRAKLLWVWTSGTKRNRLLTLT